MTTWMWIVAAVVLPAVWGNMMYRLMERMWPGPRTAAYDRKPEHERPPQPPTLPDYQI